VEVNVMGVRTITHNPDLTKEQVREAFEQHFAGKYKVEKTHAILRDFQVVKNPFVAVSIRLEQTDKETKIVYTGFTPVWWARLMFGQLFGFIFWNSLTNEVEAFIDTAPEFQRTPDKA
jgi:hypothetical protein